MKMNKSVVVMMMAVAGVAGFYYGYKLADRELPYSRDFGIASALDPAECGLPSGPVPDVIHVGDCVGPEWRITRRKICDVSPSDPYVRRRIIDRDGRVINLPLIHSLAVDGKVPAIMRKSFVQPPVPTGWVSYRARVCFGCPTDAFLMDGMINPVHLIYPVCIDELSTEYRVEAAVR